MFLRPTTLFVLLFFLASCTGPGGFPILFGDIFLHHYKVDWESLNLKQHRKGGLIWEGVAITPEQWLPKGELEKLLEGYFPWIIEAFGLKFRSSQIMDGALQDLLEQGFLPAYVRVFNPGSNPHTFMPGRLTIEVNRRSYLQPVSPWKLPEKYRAFEWKKFWNALGNVAVTITMILGSGAFENSGNARNNSPEIKSEIYNGKEIPSKFNIMGPQKKILDLESPFPEPNMYIGQRIFLWNVFLQPESEREGLVFFKLIDEPIDWSTARLISL